jgi:hypothetical protein
MQYINMARLLFMRVLPTRGNSSQMRSGGTPGGRATAGVLSGNRDRFVAFKDDNWFIEGHVITYHSPSETWSNVDVIEVNREAAISYDGNTILGNYGKVYRYNSSSERFVSTRLSSTYAVWSGGVSVSSDGSRIAMGDLRYGTEQKGRLLLEQWNVDQKCVGNSDDRKW